MADENDTTTDTKTSADDGLKRRISELGRSKAEALARVAELEERLAEAEKKAAVTDKLSGQVDEWRAKYTQLEAETGRKLALLGSGVTDPENQDYLIFQYGKLPEKDRPEFGKWIDTVKKEPKGVYASIFPASQEKGADQKADGGKSTDQKQATEQKGKGAPSVNGGTRQGPVAPDSLSVDAILDPNTPWDSVVSRSSGRSWVGPKVTQPVKQG